MSKTPKAVDTKTSDGDLAAAIKRASDSLAGLIELARLRGIATEFLIGPGPDGKIKTTKLEIKRTENLLK